MIVIGDDTLQDVSGGKIHLGAIVSGLVVGFVAGGPIGLGLAAGGIIMAQGVDNLQDLYQSSSG